MSGSRAETGSAGRAFRLLIVLGMVGLVAVVPFAVRARFQGFWIPSASMAPTLLSGDYILVDKSARWPARGDLMVFKDPTDAYGVVVKRVVGLGGEEISVRGRDVYVNCEPGATACRPMAEPYADFTGEVRSPTDVGPLQVPFSAYFVMADNRNAGEDSRHWGPVAQDQVIGRAYLIYWSSDSDGSTRWGRVGRRFR